MRDYDEILNTLTEDEKIQLVLSRTMFSEDLCSKIDANLYRFFNTTVNKQLIDQSFDVDLMTKSELFIEGANLLVDPTSLFAQLNQPVFKLNRADEVKHALENYRNNVDKLTNDELEYNQMITEEELNDALKLRLEQLEALIESDIYKDFDANFNRKVNANSFVILKNENILPLKNSLKLYIDSEDTRLSELKELLAADNFQFTTDDSSADLAILSYNGNAIDEISISSASLTSNVLVVATELQGDILDRANAIIYSPSVSISDLYNLITGNTVFTGRLAYDDSKYKRGMGLDLYPVNYVSATYNNDLLKVFLKNENDAQAKTTIIISSDGEILQAYNVALDAKEEKTVSIKLNFTGNKKLYIGPSINDNMIEVSVNILPQAKNNSINYDKYIDSSKTLDNHIEMPRMNEAEESNQIVNEELHEEKVQEPINDDTSINIVKNDTGYEVEPQYIVKREKVYKAENENDRQFSQIAPIKNKKGFFSTRAKRIISIILNVYFEAAFILAIVLSYIDINLSAFIISIIGTIVVEVIFIFIYISLHKHERYLVEAYNKDAMLDAMECQNFENVTKEIITPQEEPEVPNSVVIDEASDYVANEFDGAKSSAELIDSLVSYFASRGLGITNAKANELLSAMLASRLIVIKDKNLTLLNKALMSLRMFFGTSPIAFDMNDKLYIDTELTGTSRLYANIFSNKDNVNIQALSNVNNDLLEDIASKFKNYLLNPEVHTSFKNFALNVTLPSNLWFVMTLSDNYTISSDLLNSLFVVDLNLDEIEPISYTVYPIDYNNFERIHQSVKKLDSIPTEVWNVFDTLEREYDITICNQALKQIEVFLNSYTMNDSPVSMGIDCVISDKFVPYLLGLNVNNDHIASLGRVLSAYDSTSTIAMINSYNN